MEENSLALLLKHSDDNGLVLLRKLSSMWETLEAGDCVSNLCDMTNCILSSAQCNQELLQTIRKEKHLLPNVVAFVISNLKNPKSCNFDNADAARLTAVLEHLLKLEDHPDISEICEQLVREISCCLQHLIIADHDCVPGVLYLSLSSLQLLAKALQNVSLNECYSNVLCLLFSGKLHHITSYILTSFVPEVSKSKLFVSFIEKAFSLMLSLFSSHHSSGLVEACPQGYMILTTFIEHVYLTIGKDSCPLTTHCFWRVVQYGIVSGDSLTRKRSMYVVRHILDLCACTELALETKLFKCVKKDQLECWRIMIIVLEVLEEKQPHAVKPALAKFCSLLDQYDPLDHMHISWILMVFHRMFTHESRTVVKWALLKFMGTEPVVKFMFQENEHEFVCGPFVEVLNKPGIFTREEGEPLGSSVPLARRLTTFLEFCQVELSHCDQFGMLVLDLFAAVVKQTWNGVSLVHVSFALSHIPAMPVLNGSLLHSIGTMLTNIQRFQEPILRAAVQCYWLDISLRLIDMNKVTFDELSAFLGVFKQGETLRRGTQQWSRAVQRIGDLDHEQAIGFVREGIRKILEHEGDSTRQSICRLARMIVMLHDSGVLAQPSQLRDLLGDCIRLLSSAASRAYLPQHRKQSAMALLLALQDEAASLLNDSLQDELMDLLSPFAEEMYEHIYSSAFTPFTQMNEFQASLTSFHFLNTVSTQPAFRRLLYTLVNDGLRKCALSHEETSVVSTICIWRYFSWVIKHFPEKQHIVHGAVAAIVVSGGIGQPLVRPREWNIHDSISKAQWVAIETSAMELIWDTIGKFSLCGEHCSMVIKEAMEALQTSTQESGLHVLRAIASATSKAEEIDISQLTRCFELCWQACKDLKKSNLFRLAVETFVAIAFQPQFLRSELREHLMQITEKIEELGEVVPAVFNAFVKHHLRIWRDPANQDLLEDSATTLVRVLTYGPIYRKDQRSVFDTEAFVTSQGSCLAVNQLLKSELKVDVEVRVRGIMFIVQLNAAAHGDLAAKLCAALLAHDKEVSSGRKRYFGNSAVHRLKNRIWQAVLCLQHLLDEKGARSLLDVIYAELTEESQQPSVRTLLEFTAIRLLLRYPSLRATLIPAMQKASNKRAGCACSFIAMLVHLSASLEPEYLEAYLLEFLPELLPWCMGQHFNARVYAQVALHMVAKWSAQHELTQVQEMYRPVFLALERDIGNWSKNVKRLLDDFYFKTFNAVKHWTIETIFFELPRLTGLTDRELVSVQAMEEVMLEDQVDSFLPLRNMDSLLSDSCQSFWIDGVQDEMSVCRDDDFQKKITPWMQNLFADHSEQKSCLPLQDDIVVVASLIDRIPNLGGLCRTCEVFGARILVLSSLKHMEDRQFQNLSVSSETWLSIEEVKPHQLKVYLPRRKAEGYTLVGLEQTAASMPLQQYKFPKKSLLLLGNEKEGLPVELIQLLDVCVEIPQLGVVRSLNVHVSGAIAVWEYTKQHRLS